jgi:hypothetical protein
MVGETVVSDYGEVGLEGVEALRKVLADDALDFSHRRGQLG